MKHTNDLRFAADVLFGAASPPGHLESEPAGTGTHSTDHGDGTSWESAWIDLGGEG